MLGPEQRSRLYEGELVVSSRRGDSFVTELWQEIEQHFEAPVRGAQADFLERLGRLRARLGDPHWRDRTRQFLTELEVPVEEFAVDRLRLRAVAPGTHLIAAAAPAFYAHRDTWYANPQAQINLWMPLHAVTAHDSFGFYPELFGQAVDNDSEHFDYDEFKEQAGFQNPNRSVQAVYPRWLTDDRAPTWPVELEGGQILLFSAAHLHRTLPNLTDRIRFSVDLRLVHRAEQGAPNVDNRSRGSALADYVW